MARAVAGSNYHNGYDRKIDAGAAQLGNDSTGHTMGCNSLTQLSLRFARFAGFEAHISRPKPNG
jgi:hypothetical protein